MAQTELVLVNVTVRDKNGNPVRDLKPEDFTVLEDSKPQQVVSFDIENTDAVAHRSIWRREGLETPAPPAGDTCRASAAAPPSSSRIAG